MKEIFKTDAPLVWKFIPNTNEKYMISSWGDCMNMRPLVNADEDFLEGRLFNPQELVLVNGECYNLFFPTGKKHKSVYCLMRELFPEYYVPTDDEMQMLKQRSENDKVYIPKTLMNKMLFPNYVLKIYDKTLVKKKNTIKPTVVQPDVYGNYRFIKGHKYFGLGTSHLIHFNKNCIPHNAKPFAESSTKIWKREKNGGCKYKTEIDEIEIF